MNANASRQVIEALRATGPWGLTDEELVEASGLHRLTAPARRSELTQAGLVVSSGKTRLTTTGKSATVWVLATVANEGVQAITVHRAGPVIITRGGDRLQVCRSCGASFPPEFPEGAAVFERTGAFTDTRPIGIRFSSCRRARRIAGTRA
jgi:hypothetical protein